MLSVSVCAHMRWRKYASGNTTCCARSFGRMHAPRQAGRMREPDMQGRFIYGLACGLSGWTETGRDPERDGVQRGQRAQAAFDNWLRDRHQNEIMLVNLSSINYPRSRLQCIHYSRKSIDPAGREEQPYHTHNAAVLL